MSGDTSNVGLWTGADVYIAPASTAGPADVISPWGTDWEAVGLLSGDDGITISRDEDSSEHYGWGNILIKKTRSKHKRMIKFVALEDNKTVFNLINPGSTYDDTTTPGLVKKTVKVPQIEEFAIGFELRDGDKVTRRSVLRATLDSPGVADITASETDPEAYEITVIILTETDGTLYQEVSGSVSGS